MQLTINCLQELHRIRFISSQIVTGAILQKVTKLFNWVALSTAVSAFTKSNQDTSPPKFPLAKYNLRKVETIVKLGPFKKLTVFQHQLNHSMFMVTKT